MERHVTAMLAGVRIGAALEKQPHDCGVTSGRGRVQRLYPTRVRRHDVRGGAVLEQHRRGLELAEEGSQVERREPVGRGRSHDLRVGPHHLVDTAGTTESRGLEQAELGHGVGEPLGHPGVAVVPGLEDRRHAVGAARGGERRIGLEQPLDLGRIAGRDRLEHLSRTSIGHRATLSRGSPGVR